ncbi:MAG TPA: hypothetical protein VGO17_18485 [Aurantimonas sp.]|jgi:hypothetical protein|nr:hypothetical protein [Aurantimonas sp.]
MRALPGAAPLQLVGMVRALPLVVLALLLAGCGMNRAVGVLPNTLDDLAEQSEAWRGDDTAPAGRQP